MKLWRCDQCSWEGKSPDSVLVFFHKCRFDRVRRELFILDDRQTKEEKMLAADVEWFLNHFTPPPPHQEDTTP